MSPSLSYTVSLRPPICAVLLLAMCLIPCAFGQTTRTGPSASSTTPTVPSSSSSGPNTPCGAFNPSSPCYSARVPRNPCYSALTPNEPCSTTTTPYHSASPTTSPLKPKARLAIVHALTQDQAKAQIEAKGYSNVFGLRRDREGNWDGQAEKDGQLRSVTLDREGNVAEK